MSGGWNPLAPPQRAGFYNRIVALAELLATGGSGGVVAVPVTGDWGPDGEMVRITNEREFEDTFGPTASDDRFAVVGALTGTGEEGDGATEILVYRLPLSGQVAATKTLNNTTPATALTLTAKHKGTLGNSLTVTTRDHPSDSAYNQLVVYLSGTQVEIYSYLDADIDDLAAQINEDSDYLTAVANIDGVALANVTSQSLTGGADGSAVVGDYTDALEALESEAFNLLFIPSMTDATILAALRQWTVDQNATTRRVMTLQGGAAAETMAAAVARSGLSSDSGDLVNVGYNEWTDADGNAKTAADMVGYVAGMVAGAGSRRSITFSRLPAGFTLTRQPNSDDVIAAIEGGVVVFTRDAAGIRVESGVTTFTEDDIEDSPLDVFSKIKFVRTIHQIENDLTETTETEWIGQIPNTPASRASYLGMLLTYFGTLQEANIIKPGFSVRFDETQDNDGDTLYPIYSIEMTSPIEKVLAIGEVAV